MTTMTLTHDDYVAELTLDEDVGIFHGSVVNARPTLTFEGKTVSELRRAFADTVSDYRDWCAERGVEPGKPYSGKLSLRIDPELHRRLAIEAAERDESLNQYIVDRLAEETASKVTQSVGRPRR